MPLNRERIVDAALELLGEVGLEKLSTRRLAARLDIRNASLYWHFRNKDELLDAMSTRMYNSVIPAPHLDSADFDWAEWLADGARAAHAAALGTRDGARIMVRVRLDDPASLKRIARNVSILQEYGFSELDAHSALQTLRRFAIGSALQEQDNLGSATTSPGLAGEALFEFGLGLIIDSLRRHAAGRAGTLPES